MQTKFTLSSFKSIRFWKLTPSLSRAVYWNSKFNRTLKKTFSPQFFREQPLASFDLENNDNKLLMFLNLRKFFLPNYLKPSRAYFKSGVGLIGQILDKQGASWFVARDNKLFQKTDFTFSALGGHVRLFDRLHSIDPVVDYFMKNTRLPQSQIIFAHTRSFFFEKFLNKINLSSCNQNFTLFAGIESNSGRLFFEEKQNTPTFVFYNLGARLTVTCLRVISLIKIVYWPIFLNKPIARKYLTRNLSNFFNYNFLSLRLVWWKAQYTLCGVDKLRRLFYFSFTKLLDIPSFSNSTMPVYRASLNYAAHQYFKFFEKILLQLFYYYTCSYLSSSYNVSTIFSLESSFTKNFLLAEPNKNANIPFSGFFIWQWRALGAVETQPTSTVNSYFVEKKSFIARFHRFSIISYYQTIERFFRNNINFMLNQNFSRNDGSFLRYSVFAQTYFIKIDKTAQPRSLHKDSLHLNTFISLDSALTYYAAGRSREFFKFLGFQQTLNAALKTSKVSGIFNHMNQDFFESAQFFDDRLFDKFSSSLLATEQSSLMESNTVIAGGMYGLAVLQNNLLSPVNFSSLTLVSSFNSFSEFSISLNSIGGFLASNDKPFLQLFLLGIDCFDLHYVKSQPLLLDNISINSHYIRKTLTFFLYSGNL